MANEIQCKKCNEPAVEGRKQCRKHLDQQQAWNARYKAKRDGIAAAIPAAPKRRAVAVAADLSLDETISKLRDDLAALERAKEIMDRGLA